LQESLIPFTPVQLLEGLVKIPSVFKLEKEKEKKALVGSLIADREHIYPLTTYADPRSATLFVHVTDKEGVPVPGAYLSWKCSMGSVEDVTEGRTNEMGIGAATYLSDEIGEATVTVKATKEGYEPAEMSTKVNVVRSSVVLQVVNTPADIGEIFVNDEPVGVGKVSMNVMRPGICWVRWGDVEGYIRPDPVKVYLNPTYSVAPVVVEGLYRRADEKRDRVKLTVFAMITFDADTGIPNPIPSAEVKLSDGQMAVADISGKAVFEVKADSGPLRIKVAHPTVYGTEEEIVVNVGKKDLTVNVDFGPWFGGEETIETVRETEEMFPSDKQSIYSEEDDR